MPPVTWLLFHSVSLIFPLVSLLPSLVSLLSCLISLLLLLLLVTVALATSSLADNFLDFLWTHQFGLGTTEVLGKAEFRQLLEKLCIGAQHLSCIRKVKAVDTSLTRVTKKSSENMSKFIQCLSESQLLESLGIDADDGIRRDEFADASLALVQQQLAGVCDAAADKWDNQGENSALFYSCLSVGSICILAAFGYLLTTFTHFERLMLFVVEMAVGSLVGETVLHLLPTVVIGSEEHRNSFEYLPKLLSVSGVLCLLHILDTFSLVYADAGDDSETASDELHNEQHQEQKLHVHKREQDQGREQEQDQGHEREQDQGHEREQDQGREQDQDQGHERQQDQVHEQEHSRNPIHLNQHHSYMSSLLNEHLAESGFHYHTVTVMELLRNPRMLINDPYRTCLLIVVGDSLHNFSDGLAIGAGYVKNVGYGLRVTLTVALHEVAHEVAEFVILVNSGLSFASALIINICSALAGFVGIAIGVPLASWSSELKVWILGVTGATFLYVSLVTMMNMTRVSYMPYRYDKFLIGNFGLLVGFGGIIVITIMEFVA